MRWRFGSVTGQIVNAPSKRSFEASCHSAIPA
jgi:hypothetical protein